MISLSHWGLFRLPVELSPSTINELNRLAMADVARWFPAAPFDFGY